MPDPNTITRPVLRRSKMAPPRAFGVIEPRARIQKLLSPEHAAQLNLVHGPAGFGKTTVLRTAYTERPLDRAAWLTLDESDNDPTRFIVHLLAALGEMEVQSPEAVDEFSSLAASTDVLSRLLTALENLPAGYTIFLDEFETLYDENALDLVRQVSQNLPTQVSIIIGSRNYPSLPLGRFRMRGQLQEINASLLRFSQREVDALLRASGVETVLAQRIAPRLLEKTEGWVGSIQMAILSLSTSHDIDKFLADFTGSNTELAEFLAEDILARQADHIRSFLLDCSVIEEMRPEICDSIFDRDDSSGMLNDLTRRNMFVFAIEGPAQSYRFHNLFRSFLLAQAEAENPPRVQSIRRAAALWFSAAERPSTAIGYAFASADLNLAAQLVDAAAMGFFAAGRLTTIIEWGRQLPAAYRVDYPRIDVAYAWSLLALHKELDQVERLVVGLENRTDLEAGLRDDIVYLGPFHRILNDQFEDTAASCQQLITARDDTPAFTNGVLWNLIAYALFHEGDLSAAFDAARNASIEHRKSGSPYGQGYAECLTGWVELARARFSSARSFAEHGMQIARSGTNTAPAVVAAALSIRLCHIRGEHDQMAELIDQYGPAIIRQGTPQEIIEHFMILADMAFAASNAVEAFRVLNELRRVGRSRQHRRIVAAGWAKQAQIAARLHDLPAARDYLARAAQCHDLRQYGGFILEYTEALLATVSGDTVQAGAIAQDALHRANAAGFFLVAIQLRLLLMELHLGADETTAAKLQAAEILNLTARECCLQPLLAAPVIVQQELLRMAQEKTTSTALEFIEALRNSLGPASPVIDPHDDLIEPLSRREKEVLQLVADGCANQRIADQLFISMPTVKTHLRNINAKVKAANRTQAVAIARRHGLIDAS